jgi:unsaturated rhamnogalacturonyl hydrolase
MGPGTKRRVRGAAVPALLLICAAIARGQTTPPPTSPTPPASTPGEVEETAPAIPQRPAMEVPAPARPASPNTPAPATRPPLQANAAATPSVAAGDPVLQRVMKQWPEGRIATVKHPGEWGYEEGVLLDAMTALWEQTGDGRLFRYVQAAVDRSVDQDGVIHMQDGGPFPAEAHSLDDIEMGRSVLTLYRVTQQKHYYTAAKFVHDQLQQQPKNAAGGYWHKGIYPNQMWLDGSFMAEPFLESYGMTFAHQDDMDTAAAQLLLMDRKLREHSGGLLRHGYDATMQMAWASKTTGQSPAVWARGMGWYAMSLVDVLEKMPPSDPQRAAVEDVARRVLQAVARTQDGDSGLWWQVMDKGGQKGNFLEASASCMFVYAMAKGVREGLLALSYEQNVTRGWEGIQKRFVKPDGTLTGTVISAGLGGTPNRSGTFEYYVSEPVQDNDAKGVGAYLLALSEMVQRRRVGPLMIHSRGKTVVMDAWFNAQKRKTADGNEEYFHYKWSDESNSGYSAWGRMFQQYGMHTELLDHAPRAEDLKDVDIYVIASPDIAALNPNAHFMDKQSADAIEAWVKAGGTLVVMENDNQHADQTHLDVLMDRFGLHFNPVLRNEEIGDDYANTVVTIPLGAGGIFRHAHRALMKGTCTLTISGPAKAIVTDKGDALMGISRAGHGDVFATVDPWIYNEYTDGRNLPLSEDNFAAGQELTHWLVFEAVTH